MLLLWSGGVRDFSSSQLLSDRSAAGRGRPPPPPCEMGLASLSCTSIHAVSRGILKNAFSASKDIEFGRNFFFFFFGGVGKPQSPKAKGYHGASALATALSARLLAVLGNIKENC